MDDLILLALRDEAPNLAELPNVFFTGVGKVNAALTVSELIAKYKPRRIFNLGTAGGITQTGLVYCSKFIQRDMQCRPLMPNPGETPYETEHRIVHDINGFTCSTGDNFVTDSNLELPADVVDMEAYALAKACQRNNIKFICYKYVSDSANSSADVDWKLQISSGEPHYIRILKSYKIV